MMRRKVSREFKVEAVKLITERGVSVAWACGDLELAESVLGERMQEVAEAPGSAFPRNGQQRAGLAGVAAPEKEVSKLEAERDTRRKAAAFFAREAIRRSLSSRGTDTCGPVGRGGA